jgi:hypothetical protein
MASNEARASPRAPERRGEPWPQHVAVAGGGGAGLGLARLNNGGLGVLQGPWCLRLLSMINGFYWQNGRWPNPKCSR